MYDRFGTFVRCLLVTSHRQNNRREKALFKQTDGAVQLQETLDIQTSTC